MFSCVRVSAVDEDDDEVAGGTAPSTPKEKLPMKSKKHSNPFSARGLERFAVLSAELQARRQKIMAQLGDTPADDVTVRFAYTNSTWVPVIIKQTKPQEKQLDAKHHCLQRSHKPSAGAVSPKPLAKVAIASPPLQSAASSLPSSGQKKGTEKSDEIARAEKGSLLDRKRIITWACSGFQLANSEPMILVALLLLCLLFSGKTFAVLFTAFWWYLGAAFRELGVDGSRPKVVGSVRKKKGRRYQVP
ncbi:unnamed protein product [Victoria cruziana]